MSQKVKGGGSSKIGRWIKKPSNQRYRERAKRRGEEKRSWNPKSVYFKGK